MTGRLVLRRGFRPDLEGLSERCLLSVVALGSATQTNFQTVSIDYQIAASNINSLTVDIDRSSAPRLGAGNQVAIGSVTLSGADVTPGVHNNVPLVLGTRSPGVDALAIDPAHPYVIAAATGPDGITSSASYQTITIGLVTHGFDSSDTAPAWIYQIATALTNLGYNDAIPFDWATDSHALQSGEGVQNGINAAHMIESYINGTNSQGQPNVPAGAVVDLHLIGHSRGSVVITYAMQTLQSDLAKIPQAAGGFWELTYLDPHPSHGTNVAPFSATSQYLIDGANFLQNQFQDPYPLTVPSQVALAQIDYENTPVSDIVSTTEEGQLNPWGITYPTGIQATTGASTQFQMLNLTTPGMDHSAVYEWYQANVVPTLGTANPLVTGPIDAPIVANGENLSVTAGSILLNRVAYFSDNNPNRSTSDYNTTIDWGDHTSTSTGLVVGTPDLGFFVGGIHTYNVPGTYHYTVTIVHPGGSMTTATGTVDVTPAMSLTGASSGQAPQVSLMQTSTGQTLAQFLAFPASFTGGVRVASADVNGDGTPDIIAATGPGAPGQVRVFDGISHQLTRRFYPFGRGYRGGLTVAAGFVDSDGDADIAVGNASGAVRLFSGADGSLLASFQVRAAAASFRHGTGLSIADLDQDGRGDVVASTPTGSTLKLLHGTTVAQQEAKLKITHFKNPKFAGTLNPNSFLSGALRFANREVPAPRDPLVASRLNPQRLPLRGGRAGGRGARSFGKSEGL